MKTEDALYIKILIWAYNKQETGFSWEDLKKEFQLSPAQEQWVQKIFSSNPSHGDNNLIERLSDGKGFMITAKGTSAAIGYLNLKEAERSGKRAERIAWVAISTGIIVGAVQIIIGLIQLNSR